MVPKSGHFIQVLPKSGHLIQVLLFFFFFKLEFIPCKAGQSSQGMELQEKEAQKRLKHTGNLFGKNLELKGVC